LSLVNWAEAVGGRHKTQRGYDLHIVLLWRNMVTGTIYRHFSCHSHLPQRGLLQLSTTAMAVAFTRYYLAPKIDNEDEQDYN
jgi:hypothetical protein